MKLLIILFLTTLSLNSYAELRAFVKNLDGSDRLEQTFDNEADYLYWKEKVNSNAARKVRGLNLDYWVHEDKATELQKQGTSRIVNDGWLDDGESWVEYFVPQNFTVTKEDITDQVELEAENKLKDKNELEAIRPLVKNLLNVTNEQYKKDVKRILVRILKKMNN